MALPLNVFASSFAASAASGTCGSLTSTTIVLPLTSTPLKSSQLNSGACTPYPAKIISEPWIAAPSPTRFVQATTSSDHLNVCFCVPFVTVSGWLFVAVMPTSGTFCVYVPSVLPGCRPSFLNSSSRYLTVRSSPCGPGARPSYSSAESALMRSRIRPASICAGGGCCWALCWEDCAGGLSEHAAHNTRNAAMSTRMRSPSPADEAQLQEPRALRLIEIVVADEEQ